MLGPAGAMRFGEIRQRGKIEPA
ncbi:MAG: hypothetical protein K0Q69_3938, partial [Devosia sp.]|nr:hypothetical protein [Devosia sp.]